MIYQQKATYSCDSYKLGHPDQYPKGTTKVTSNLTPRSLRLFNTPTETNKIVWFGISGFLQELNAVWKETFFDRVWGELEPELISFYTPFCGPNGFNTDRLKALHILGYLPLEIKALPEATLVPAGVPVLTITNTKPEFYWLPNYLETWLSADLWKMSTSATIAFEYRKLLEKFAKETGGNKDFIMWQSHDFSVRGMSGVVDAAHTGAGHLLSSMGTDNLPAVDYVNQLYGGKKTFVGGSVPATEHVVMCAGGMDGELETFRPDSGDPVKILTGYKVDSFDDAWAESEAVKANDGKYYSVKVSNVTREGWTIDKELSEAEIKGAVECLWDIFGGTTNELGYRTLNQRVGLIYGDSITLERANNILQRLKDKGFASDNVVFGVGSFTYQYVTRDTLGFAMKATYVEIDGVGREIFKDPKTDSGTKKSARGLLKVIKDENGDYKLIDQVSVEEEKTGELRTVFKDGEIIILEELAQLRERLVTYL